jgi:hypothetical protein
LRGFAPRGQFWTDAHAGNASVGRRTRALALQARAARCYLVKPMADVKPPFKLTDAQRQVGDVIAAFALKVARPLYWHNGALNPERAMQGGTAFVLEMDGGFIGVTACHVIRLYEEALKKNPKLVCQRRPNLNFKSEGRF